MCPEEKNITCPLCGKVFAPSEVMKSCPAVCPLHCGSCKNLKCPNCGYSIPGESALINWLGGIIDKIKPKTDNGDNHD